MDDCPVWEDYDESAACSLDCGAPPSNYCGAVLGTGCRFATVEDRPGVVRTPWTDDTCGAECGSMVINLFATPYYVRVIATPPWAIRTSVANNCRDLAPCVVLAPNEASSVLVSAPFGSGPSNVVVEDFDIEPSCP